jgi:hypothetical protein
MIAVPEFSSLILPGRLSSTASGMIRASIKGKIDEAVFLISDGLPGQARQ